MRPEPTPEPTNTSAASSTPFAAPSCRSPHAAAERSFTIRTRGAHRLRDHRAERDVTPAEVRRVQHDAGDPEALAGDPHAHAQHVGLPRLAGRLAHRAGDDLRHRAPASARRAAPGAP